MAGDVLTVDGDTWEGEALIRPVLRHGRRLAPVPGIEALRAHAAKALARLPGPLKRLEAGAAYPVEVAPALRSLAEDVDARMAPRAAPSGVRTAEALIQVSVGRRPLP